MKEILDKLKSMDKKQLSEAVKQAKAYADTPQGKDLVEKLKKGDAGIPENKQMEIRKKLEENPDISKAIFDILKG